MNKIIFARRTFYDSENIWACDAIKRAFGSLAESIYFHGYFNCFFAVLKSLQPDTMFRFLFEHFLFQISDMPVTKIVFVFLSRIKTIEKQT